MKQRFRATTLTVILVVTHADAALGHEAWLLTPSEIIALASEPVPALFTDSWLLALAGFAAAAAAAIAVWAGERLAPLEDRICRPMTALAAELGPLCVRLGLACMLSLGSVGGLPRNGTAAWTQPTLFVPDMQMSLVDPRWGWLVALQLALATLLAFGALTRLAAFGVVMLCAMGVAAFGGGFLAYAPHFLAPALLLLVYGGGRLSLDRALGGLGQPLVDASAQQALWRVALVLFGANFAYHGIHYKLMQPTLMIAIMQHGNLPTLGASHEVAALAMALVEISAGTLLAMGRLVRPIALLLIGAFTFFAAALGETPLFHANLYGAMAMLAMAGGAAPMPAAIRPRPLPIRSQQRG